jgi:tyrosyl-tRNA synthetase
MGSVGFEPVVADADLDHQWHCQARGSLHLGLDHRLQPEAGLLEGQPPAGGTSVHPNSLKEELAVNIVAQYHGKDAAEKAAQTEKKIHAGDILPDDMPVVPVAAGEHYLAGLIVLTGLAKSNGEARRLIENSGVSWDGAKVRDVKANVAVTGEHVLRTGKRAFARVTVAQ